MIKTIGVPTKVPDIGIFVGLVNYYRDMWRKRSHTISPLTKLCSTKVKFKWTDVENNDFIATKKIVGGDALIYYPKFIKGFIMHTYASKTKIAGVIGQMRNQLPFTNTN